MLATGYNEMTKKNFVKSQNSNDQLILIPTVTIIIYRLNYILYIFYTTNTKSQFSNTIFYKYLDRS